VALSSDWLFPPEQSAELANALVAAGKDVSFCTLTAPHGHDAFLVDVEHLSETIRAFLPWVSPGGGRKPSPEEAAAIAAKAAERSGSIAEEHRRIASMVRHGAKVLDLGCGDGDLLSVLAHQCRTTGVGIDMDLAPVIRVMDRGHDALQLDLDRGLSSIPDLAYDYAILSGTIQQVRRPRVVLREMLRVARECIVAFPNFAHWRNRCRLALRGRMPKSEVLPFEWYETPNIHLATLVDVMDLLRAERVRILEVVCLPGGAIDRMLVSMGRCSLGAQRVLVRLTRGDAPSIECGKCLRCRL
jgi:homoserine O-acetyltransferase